MDYGQSVAKNFLQFVPSDLQLSPKATNSFHSCTLDSQAPQQQGDQRVHLKAVSERAKNVLTNQMGTSYQLGSYLCLLDIQQLTSTRKFKTNQNNGLIHHINKTQDMNLVSNISQFPSPTYSQIFPSSLYSILSSIFQIMFRRPFSLDI